MDVHSDVGAVAAQNDEVPLNAIRAFVTVAREGSVARAATTLGTTQSSVSRYLSVLRDYLGAT
ncbi:LysR family transcriptional regulator [Bradyrhizobium sp. C-145]|uniref:helix-turn-helix domain-containing protein n=1 Tax=Bradyrhizobium sp. C-145 TaxID=574727 RepID=UPI00201B5752|nr:LysR family transcriptional regulator [Bradyrhizobium sp. C-145]UQR61424.1 LysR family transcriptional regulator [Bradyrhizobium sp. C-145]